MPCHNRQKTYLARQFHATLKNNIYFYCLVVISLAGCNPKVENPADAIYFNGEILTMLGLQPAYVESVAIKNGRIVFVGPLAEADTLRGSDTKMVDLQGQTLLPGFIDAHGHVAQSGIQRLTANLYPPPDGDVNSVAGLVESVNQWQSINKPFIDKVGWIIGFGYDDSQLAERRHPLASDLDLISPDVPVLLIHQSGHLGVMNTKGLQVSGYVEGARNPSGGVIRRTKGTTMPNGVLEEMALFQPLFGILSKMDEEMSKAMVLAGIDAYTKYGFTTAQEGRATGATCDLLRKMAGENALAIDVVAYPDIEKELAYMLAHKQKDQFNYFHNFRLGGVKISLDGSPQGKTAWLTKPYLVPPEGKEKNYRGYPAIPDEKKVFALVDSAFANNWQILAHCNGDAAADQYFRALRHAITLYGNDDRRSVMIHAQTVRDDQLDSMQNMYVIPSFFGMHTFYWGDWHRDETLGKERAYRISPASSAFYRGIIFTQHHDAPVATPDAMRILWSVVNRISRTGDVIGADQRISAYLGLLSITRWAAFQYFEGHLKGVIEVGKLADFVILSANPVKVEPIYIDKIQVVETIKEGKTVYKSGL